MSDSVVPLAASLGGYLSFRISGYLLCTIVGRTKGNL